MRKWWKIMMRKRLKKGKTVCKKTTKGNMYLIDMLQKTRKSKLKQTNRTKGEKFLSLEITTKTSSQLLRDAIKLLSLRK